MKKKLLAILLSVFMLMNIAPVSIFAVDGYTDNIHYVWDSTNSTLTISKKEGAYNGFENFDDSNPAPWNEFKEEISTIIISEGITGIGSNSFKNCTNLTSVSILNNDVTSIGDYAFYGCSRLSEINLPSSLTHIGVQAFDGCSSLTSITIPENVSSIYNKAFANCTNLSTVNVNGATPPTMFSPSNGQAPNQFEGCSDNLKIWVPVDSFSNYVSTWSTYAEKIETTPTIGMKFFRAGLNYEITALNSTNEVKVAQYWNYSGSIEIPSTVSFGGVEFGVTAIDSNAFEYSDLTDIIIPASVVSIGKEAFVDSESLSTVTVKSTNPPTLGMDTFKGCVALTAIKVPEESVDYYTNSDSNISKGWYAYKDKITTIPITIADILPNNFPDNENDNSWCNSEKDNVYIYIYKDEPNSKLIFAETPFTDGVLISSVLTKADKDQSWSDTTTCRLVYSTDDIEIQFNMAGDEGDELENIIVSRCRYEACAGTYNPPEPITLNTVGDILATVDGGFPTATVAIPENAWVKSGNIKMKCYKDINALHFGDDQLGLGSSISKTNDDTYTAVTDNYGTITFNLVNGKLINITHAGGYGMSSVNGTYAAITIADILDTLDEEYPVAVDEDTVPEGCWTTPDGYRLFYITDKTELLISDTPYFSIDPTQVVTLDAEGNYITTVTLFGEIDIYVTMVMDNNKLQRIEASAPAVEMSYVFEPVGNRITLGELFDSLTTRKPVSLENSWVNENNMHIYVNAYDYLYSEEVEELVSSFSCLNPSDNSYSATVLLLNVLPLNVIANMDNDVFKSLTIEISSEEVDRVCTDIDYLSDKKDSLKKLNGTYSAPITIAEILPADFPATSEAAWVYDDDYLYLKGESVWLDDMVSVFDLDQVVTLDTDGNYCFIDAELGGTFTFIMDDGVFTSIKVSGLVSPFAGYNGTYTVPQPPPAPVYYDYGPTYYTVASNDSTNGSFKVDRSSMYSGGNVTVTVTPDKGFVLETLTVLDKNGKEIEVKDLGNNKYSFTMPSGKVDISATFMEDNRILNYCVDVKADDYYYDAVLWAYENEICKGVDKLHFNPLGIASRAEMLTFMWRAAGSPEPKVTTTKFTDVDSNSYYYKAVLWAVEKGITTGTSETTFNPSLTVDRAQTVTFLARFAGVKDDAAGYTADFTDVPANEYYSNAVAWAYKNKITDGTGGNKFSPFENCQRGQVVTFLYRQFAK